MENVSLRDTDRPDLTGVQHSAVGMVARALWGRNHLRRLLEQRRRRRHLRGPRVLMQGFKEER